MVGPELLALLRRERLLPIVRAQEPEHAEAVARALIECGFGLLEISLTTPDAPALIRRLVDSTDGVVVGAGTVLEPAQVEEVVDSGAGFVVTPALTDALAAATSLGVAAVVGALTPTEVVAAIRAGATAVKLFPAELAGPRYLSALRAPLPDVPFVPVGGVTVKLAQDYLRRGAVALGLGSTLVGDAADGGSLDALAERAAGFLALRGAGR